MMLQNCRFCKKIPYPNICRFALLDAFYQMRD